MRSIRSAAVLVLLAASAAHGARLSINWEGLADQRTIELAVGEEAVIEIWVDLNEEDTLAGVFFHNEELATVRQVGFEAVPAGWRAYGVNDVLGPTTQELSLFAELLADVITALPGSYLVGTQVVVLEAGNVGEEQEVTLSLSNADLTAANGASFLLVASDADSADQAGVYHIGAGSPGYQRGGISDERDPLIILVVEDGSGGGGSGGGGNSNTNDNTNTNANDNSSPDDNTNDNANSNANDNANTNANDNSNDNVNGNSNENVNGNVNANDNSGTEPNDNSNANTNENSNGNDNSSEPTSSGPCGMGAVSMMPFSLAGLLLMQAHRRRRG